MVAGCGARAGGDLGEARRDYADEIAYAPAWGSEEQEEDEDEQWVDEGMPDEGGEEEHLATGGRRARLGRQEREAARRAGSADAGGEDRDADHEWEGDALLDARLCTLYRAASARANYLALDRPELSFATKELCWRMSSPGCETSWHCGGCAGI